MSIEAVVGVTFTLALLFYTIGVWSELLAKRLKGWHLSFFWGGVIFDTAATGILMKITGRIVTFDLHGLTGWVALLLMIFHATWASVVLVRKDEKALANFHKFSIVVWMIWLIPYGSGFVIEVLGGNGGSN